MIGGAGWLLVWAAAGAAALGQARPASQPTTRSVGRAAFQPGVTIDWKQRAVLVEAQVVLRQGPLEFFACLSGKEHESVLLMKASATHVYLALGLIGLTPGHPPRWDEAAQAFRPPAGDLIDVSVEWKESGAPRSAPASAWLREIKYARAPFVRPWVFAGSRRLENDTLAADRSGHGIALVDHSDSLLAQSRSYVSRDADLWVEANTPRIPPLGTTVQLVLRAARPRDFRVRVDFRGAALVDDRYASIEDLADLLLLGRRMRPAHVQTLRLERTLEADLARLRARLSALGVPAAALRFERVGAAGSRP